MGAMIAEGGFMTDRAGFFLRCLPMRVTLVSGQRAALPEYLGSTLRGVVGHAARGDRNAYDNLYNSKAARGGSQDIVNPYIITPPPMRAAPYEEGEELTFMVSLLGDASKMAGPLVEALKKLRDYGLGASRYPFLLAKVTHEADRRVIWEDGVYYPSAAQGAALPWRELRDVRRVAVRTLTPLRIRRNGELIDQVDFPTVIRNITRRVEAIATRYGGWADTLEIERIQALTADVSTVFSDLHMASLERLPSQPKEKMNFQGLMGEVRFEGDITPFVPWLFAARTLHIGRNTTFGMGRVEVEFT
jgi:hypothetical protein